VVEDDGWGYINMWRVVAVERGVFLVRELGRVVLRGG